MLFADRCLLLAGLSEVGRHAPREDEQLELSKSFHTFLQLLDGHTHPYIGSYRQAA